MSRIKNPRAYLSQAALIARNPVFRAMCQKVMRPAQQVDLALDARIAFESVSKGTCNAADRDTLAGTVNVCMVLCETHCAPNDLQITLDAQAAMLRADVRALHGKTWNFDAAGRTAWLQLLDMHEQLIAQLGQAALTTALLDVIDRRKRGQVHQIKEIAA